MGENTAAEVYTKIWVADFFHVFPHVNFLFETVNHTFDPESHQYQEALGFWGLVPVAACFLLWLVFLIYFFVRCCQSSAKSKQRPSCLSIITGLFIAIGIGLLGYGLYENRSTHEGMENTRRAVIQANNTIMVASERVDLLDNISQTISTNICDDIEHALVKLPNRYRKKATKLIEHIRTEANSVRGYLGKIHVEDEKGSLNDAINISNDVEYYRWLTIIVVYCIFIVLFVMYLIGLLVKSKVVLIVSTTLCVICSLFIWVTTGAYIFASVSMGDLCVDPDSYFISLAERRSDKVALEAYIKCIDTQQPYQKEILNAQISVTEALTELNKTVQIAKPYKIPQLDEPIQSMQDNLQYAAGNLSFLLNSVGICSTLHNNYVTAVKAFCIDTLQGTAILCLISCIVAIICTVTIFLMSCVWRQYSIKKSKRAQYVPVDDTDPFLPRPPQYDQGDYGTMGHSSPCPWSERGSLHNNSSSNVNAEDLVVIMTHQQPYAEDESPPPAYFPGRYIRQ